MKSEVKGSSRLAEGYTRRRPDDPLEPPPDLSGVKFPSYPLASTWSWSAPDQLIPYYNIIRRCVYGPKAVPERKCSADESREGPLQGGYRTVTAT